MNPLIWYIFKCISPLTVKNSKLHRITNPRKRKSEKSRDYVLYLSKKVGLIMSVTMNARIDFFLVFIKCQNVARREFGAPWNTGKYCDCDVILIRFFHNKDFQSHNPLSDILLCFENHWVLSGQKIVILVAVIQQLLIFFTHGNFLCTTQLHTLAVIFFMSKTV